MRAVRSIPWSGRSAAISGQAVFMGAAVVLLPELALACPVCFSAASERVFHTYYLTAVVMTLLPVAIVALFAGWLRRRFKQAAE